MVKTGNGKGNTRPLSETYPNEHCGAPNAQHAAHPYLRRINGTFRSRWCMGGAA
jgi:hypothetical protein